MQCQELWWAIAGSIRGLLRGCQASRFGWMFVALTTLGGFPAGVAAMEGVVRVYAVSEAFELVGRLQPAGLVFWLDRAPSNMPVAGARLVVDVDGHQAEAHFREVSQDYLLEDAVLRGRLQRAGEQVLTVQVHVPPAGVPGGSAAEEDVLVGFLEVPEDLSPASLSGRYDYPMAALGIVFLGLTFWGIFRRRGRA